MHHGFHKNLFSKNIVFNILVFIEHQISVLDFWRIMWHWRLE